MSDDYCRLMFKKVMEYLQKDEVQLAGSTFACDCNKMNIDLGPIKCLFFCQSDKNELIKLISGYSFMPSDIKQYYYNPEKAFIDFPK